MKLIYGEHSSGKSSKALEFIKNKPRVFYFSLDKDQSVKSMLHKHKAEAEFQIIKNCFLIDIELAIVGRDGNSNYDTIVIDSLNFIKSINDVGGYSKLKHILKGLEYLHHAYNVEIIATYNILSNLDKMRRDVNDIFSNRKDWELIETTSKRKKKEASLLPVKYTRKEEKPIWKITTKDGVTEITL